MGTTEGKAKGPASYFPSIEKTYGKPVAHWFALLEPVAGARHMDQVALLKKVQANAKDEDLRKLAGEMVPVVSGHLEHARKLPRARK